MKKSPNMGDSWHGDIIITEVASTDNLADLFTKAFQFHMDMMGVRYNILWTCVQVKVCWELYAYMFKYLIII